MRKADPILMAAKDTFIEKGFGNCSMDEIAARAGTTKRTVYNNFGSKERLLDAVIDHAIGLFGESVPPLPPRAGAKQQTQFLEILLQLMTWRPAIGLQRMIVAEGTAFPDIAQRLSQHTGHAMRQPLIEHFSTHGFAAAAARVQAESVLDVLTSRARLDRLVGLRLPYPALPGTNTLDQLDRAAVRAALDLLRAQGRQASAR